MSSGRSVPSLTGVGSVQTLSVDGWAPARAMAAKRDRRVSVVFPCQNEAATIGRSVSRVRRALVDEVSLVDELIVVDDDSTDGSARIAADAGARVVAVDEVGGWAGGAKGKGNAVWVGLVASTGDVVAWLDADVTTMEPSWVVRLVGPLLERDDLVLMKASYHRPTDAGGGGRTTELVARPLLSLLAPELACLEQPLAGEFAGRRAALEAISMPTGWGVEIAMLLDLAEAWGPSAIGQIDLGVRRHRHRGLDDLAVQAAEVTAAVLTRTARQTGAHEPVLRRADGTVVRLQVAERPPAASVRHRRPA
jgi:glucosyl-3-phosphoglycerate synthase